MKWLYRNLHKKEKGFTLVELMVVIIILAVLTGIAIPSYLTLRNRARIQATRSEMQNIGTALELYAADNYDAYPAGVWTVAAGLIEAGDYMNPCPTHDAWGSADANLYVYAVTDDGYTLTSDAGGGTDIVLTTGQLAD